jgi:hypothetical protein
MERAARIVLVKRLGNTATELDGWYLYLFEKKFPGLAYVKNLAILVI